MTKSKTLVEADKKEMKVVRSQVQSTSERFASVLVGIGDAYLEAGGSFSKLASISGEAGAEKRRRIGELVYEVVHDGMSNLSVGTIELAQKLGVIEEVTDIPAPQGGKVFRVLISIDWAKSWKEYILPSCPETPKDWDILNMGDQFESRSTGSEIKEVIFLWFGKNVYGTVEKADAWATASGLTSSHGRIPAAAIGAVPGIIGQLQNLGFPYSSVGIVSTAQCKLDGDPRVPYAWQDDDGERGASLIRVSYEWGDYGLFAFFRK